MIAHFLSGYFGSNLQTSFTSKLQEIVESTGFRSPHIRSFGRTKLSFDNKQCPDQTSLVDPIIHLKRHVELGGAVDLGDFMRRNLLLAEFMDTLSLAAEEIVHPTSAISRIG